MRHATAAGSALMAIVLATGLFMVTDAAHTADSKPAAITPRVAEGDLQTVTLSEQAEQRLGIRTAKIERREVRQSRLYGGEIIAAGGNGREVGSAFPGGGAGLYQLADARIAANGRVRQAQAQLEGAQKSLVRAQRMLADESGSARAVEEAQTLVSVAQAEYTAASARRELLGGSDASAGASRHWVRTAVFASDLNSLDRAAAAAVSTLGSHSDDALSARPVSARPSADPTAGTVDFFYEVIRNKSAAPLHIGQRVQVRISLTTAKDSLVVPWSAVVHDINGGSWVYQLVGPRTYARRAVQVTSVNGDSAALASGPAADSVIVITGVAELFGTEFGVGH
jgi:hypothetical protein